MLLGKPGNFSNGLDCSDFVVGMHDRDENGVGAYCLFDFRSADQTLRVNRQTGDPEAILFQEITDFQYSRMFNGACDDMGFRQVEGFSPEQQVKLF